MIQITVDTHKIPSGEVTVAGLYIKGSLSISDKIFMRLREEYLADIAEAIANGYITITKDGAALTQDELNDPTIASFDIDNDSIVDSAERLYDGTNSVTALQAKTAIDTLAGLSIPDVSGKADKAIPASVGNIATLDATGNLTDSGSKAADFAAASAIPDVSGKVDKVVPATAFNIATLDAVGGLADSGALLASLAASVHGHNNVEITSPATLVVYVDNNRTDTYTADGSFNKPFKSIQAGINYIASLDATLPYTLQINTGYYRENVVVEDSRLRKLIFKGIGVVNIEPASGNAFQSTANNNNLVQLMAQNITFGRPMVITGANGAASFSNVIFDNCNWSAGAGGGFGTLTLTCINNFSIRFGYIETDVTFNNVNWSWIESTQMQGALNVSYSDTNIPSWGKDAAILMNGVYFSGNLTAAVTGTATATLCPSACRLEIDGATIPANYTVIAYNSYLRGAWVNNGVLTLRGSFVQGTITGTGTTNYHSLDSQIANSSTIAGTTVKAALDAIDLRLKALEP